MKTANDFKIASYEAAQILLELSEANGTITPKDRECSWARLIRLGVTDVQLTYDLAVTMIKATRPVRTFTLTRLRLIAIFVKLNEVFNSRFPDFQVTDPVDLAREDATI